MSPNEFLNAHHNFIRNQCWHNKNYSDFTRLSYHDYFNWNKDFFSEITSVVKSSAFGLKLENPSRLILYIPFISMKLYQLCKPALTCRRKLLPKPWISWIPFIENYTSRRIAVSSLYMDYIHSKFASITLPLTTLQRVQATFNILPFILKSPLKPQTEIAGKKLYNQPRPTRGCSAT